MTDNQPGPDHYTLSAAYQQAGYTIEDPPDFQGADAAALWVARDEQLIAVLTCRRAAMKPGVLLTRVNHLSQHARIHIVTDSRGRANQVQDFLRNPVRRRTDCGVQCYHHSVRFVLDGARLAVSEPYVWIATSGEQPPPDGTVLSVPATLATPFGDEAKRANQAANAIKKQPAYESTVTELESTETPGETSQSVRTPVITDQADANHGVVVAIRGESGLTVYNPERESAFDPLQHEKTPQRVLGDAPWEMSAPPALAVTRLHLIPKSEWEAD
jgi:hypothetical protein